MSRRARPLGPALVVALAFGCGGPSANRSPLATDDPPRFERARAQDAAAARASRTAEARFFRAARAADVAAVVAEPNPMTADPHPMDPVQD